MQAEFRTSQPSQKIILAHLDLAKKQITALGGIKLGLELRLFHTQKKVPTHDHLHELSPTTLNEAWALVEKATAALQTEAAEFCHCINAYAAWMENNSLLAPHSAAALKARPKVFLAAKGCGALGADVLLTLSAENVDVSAWVQEFSLLEIFSTTI